jgi:hypothetical protein
MMPAMSLDVIAGVHSPEKSGPLNELGTAIRSFDHADVAGTRATQVIENKTTEAKGGARVGRLLTVDPCSCVALAKSVWR